MLLLRVVCARGHRVACTLTVVAAVGGRAAHYHMMAAVVAAEAALLLGQAEAESRLPHPGALGRSCVRALVRQLGHAWSSRAHYSVSAVLSCRQLG
eukprot:scaffold1620_cov420-Prasinococcus_capsulatus_cf.AAC.6